MPRTSIHGLSVVPNDNTDINGVNVGEGCPAATLNDAQRALAGFVKQYALDMGGSVETAGSGNAYTAAINASGLAAYADGIALVLKFDRANTDVATLNVNSIGAKSLRKGVDSPLASGDIQAGQILMAVYNSDANSAAGGWVLISKPSLEEVIPVAVTAETYTIRTGDAKQTFRMPFAMTLSAIHGSLSTASTSGLVTVDVNKNATTVFTVKLTIDANEKTSRTAATPAVLSVTSLAQDDEITIDIDGAGTGAKGLKLYLYGTRT